MEMDHRPRGCFLDSSEGPLPSETENRVRLILQNQMDTKITLASQFERHREFCDAGELHTLPPSSAGLRSALHVEQQMQQLASASKGVDVAGSLCKSGSDGSGLTEVESEARNCGIPLGKSLKLPEDPFVHVAEYAKRLDARRKKPKRAAACTAQEAKTAEDKTERPADLVDPSLWHVVVPLTEKDILDNRLTLEEIRQIPRFADYKPGEPQSVLFLKNVHSKARLEELIALFGQYDKPEARVKCRIMSGRMRGQAFVSFSDKDTAIKALQLVNGYKLRGQPLIATFARCKPRGSLEGDTFQGS